MQPCAGKRAREGADDGALAAEAKRPACSGTVVQLQVAIDKDGKTVGTLEMPALKPHQRCTFGRAAEATVRLQHQSISRIHAELAVRPDGTVYLTDLASGARRVDPSRSPRPNVTPRPPLHKRPWRLSRRTPNSHVPAAVAADVVVLRAAQERRAVHGTNVDGVWIKANDSKRLQVGTRFLFGASSRLYVVERLEVCK